MSEGDLATLTSRLAEHSNQYDISGEWPAESLKLLSEWGCWRWPVPRCFGGDELVPTSAIEGYEAIARGCMTTALILTQHDAAIDLIVTSENDRLKADLCPRVVSGEWLLTVGISQLTTSRQGGVPAMKVTLSKDGAVLNGDMPWATSTSHCDGVVTGGVLPDGRQLVGYLSMDTKGVEVHAPASLAALEHAHTSLIHCDQVRMPRGQFIRGPTDKALAIRSTVRPLVVSSCGLGLAGAMLAIVQELAPRRADGLGVFARDLDARYQCVRRDLYRAADQLNDPEAEPASGEIRAAVNDLIMRLAVTMVTFAKGTGYTRGHPAQRLAREGMFFLVWSAPESVQIRTLIRLLSNPPASTSRD